MLQKLKQKITNKILSVSALSVFILSSFLYFIPQTALATTFPLAGITIKTDTLTKTKSGVVLNNLVRVGKDEPITFTVRLTLTNPSSGIVLNTDKVDYGLGPNEPFSIIEFGAGADKVIGSTCVKKWVTSANIQGLLPFVGSDNKTYMTCSFPGGTRLIATKVDANKAYDLTFSSTATALGLDKTQRGTKQSFAVYPYMRMELWGPNANSVFENASKEIYVEFFETPAEAQAAIDQNKPAPAGVPGYGSNTGSGETDTTGGGLLDLLNRIIGFILGLVQEFIYAVFFWLIAPLIQAMLSIHPYTDTFVAVIYPGWEVIRNLCNIFFILALIIIAMATLFRVDSYKFKDLIIQLIIAALLVNFSLVIAQVILGLADTIQAQFLPANVTVIRSLAADLMVTNYRSAVYQSTFGSQGTFASTVQPLFYLALSLGSFAVFSAIAIFLVVRIVMLWLLLMISPIAYAVGVLPATAKYRGEWWGMFIKYAFFTPIMAFMLNMAAVISNTSRNNPVLQSIDGLATASENSSDIATFVLKVGSNILLLVFLVAALMVAEKAGIYGASAVTEVAKKGMFAPFAGAKYLTADIAGGYLQKKYNNATAKLAEGKMFKGAPNLQKALFAGLHIPSTVKAFRKDSSEELARSQSLVEAGALSVKRQVPGFKRQGEDPLAVFNEHKGEELLAERFGKEASSSEQFEVQLTLDMAKKAMAGSKDDQLMLPAQLRRLFKNHNMNDFVEKYGVILGLKEGELKYNKSNLVGVLHDLEKKGAMSEHVAEDFQKRLGSLAYDSKDLTGAEMTWTDDHGHTHIIKTEFIPAEKKFKVVGMDDYIALRDFALNYASANGLNKEQRATLISDIEKNNTQGTYGDQATAFRQSRPGFNQANYINAMKDQTKIVEKNNNLSKKGDIDQITQWWESLVTKDATGNIRLGSSGKYLFTHWKSGHEFAATRGNFADKVQALMMPMVINHPDILKENLKDAILENSRAVGKLMPPAVLAKKVAEAEYKTLRVAFMAAFRNETDLKNTIREAGELGDGSEADYIRLSTALRTKLNAPGVLDEE